MRADSTKKDFVIPRFPQLTDADFWETPKNFTARFQRLVACVNSGDAAAVNRALKDGYPGPGIKPHRKGHEYAGLHPLPKDIFALLSWFHSYTPHTVRFDLDKLTCEHLLWYPLLTSVREERHDIAKSLLEAGALAWFGGKDYDRPITRAVTNKDERMVSLLLEYGASPDSGDHRYQPLSMALCSKNKVIARRLCEALKPGEPLPHSNDGGPLFYAIEHGLFDELADCLLPHATPNDFSEALHAALNPYKEKAVELVARLIKHGADPAANLSPDGNAFHALFDRVWYPENDAVSPYGPERPFDAVRKDTLALVELLLLHSVPLDARNGHGFTPLLSAAAYLPFPEVLRRLIAAGASLHDKKSPSPSWLNQHKHLDQSAEVADGLLGCVAFSEYSHPEMFRTVIAMGFSADHLAEKPEWVQGLYGNVPRITPLRAAVWTPEQWRRIITVILADDPEATAEALENPALPEEIRSLITISLA